MRELIGYDQINVLLKQLIKADGPLLKGDLERIKGKSWFN